MPIEDSLKSNKQHAVPQNIMDVEFKLIGDLTMRQFFYLMVFAGIAYAAYSFNLPVVFKWPTVIGSVLLGLGFAFVPVEDRGLDEWIINFFQAVYEENQMIWRKEPTPPSAFLLENISMVKQELITLAPTSSRRKLENYLQYKQDTQDEDPLDIPIQEYVEKVRTAFMTSAPPKTSVTLKKPMIGTPVGPTIGPPDQKQKIEKGPRGAPIKKALIASTKSITKIGKQVRKLRLPTPSGIRPLAPITPDRHSGRKFTNLLETGGSIVLPIRGEKTIKTFATEEVEGDSQEKAEQLKQFLTQLEQTEGIKVPKSISTKTKQKATKQGFRENTAPLPQRQKDLTPGKPAAEVETKKLITPKVPNVITGVVRSQNGDRMQNVLLIIKNAHGDPVRAIKTNALGMFTISNPLPNGAYKISVDVNEETGLSFDIIDVETKGEIISPLEFVGK